MCFKIILIAIVIIAIVVFLLETEDDYNEYTKY